MWQDQYPVIILQAQLLKNIVLSFKKLSPHMSSAWIKKREKNHPAASVCLKKMAWEMIF